MKNNFKILKGPTEIEQEEAFKDLSPDEILLKASRYGSLKWIKIALKKGANIYTEGNISFQLAIRNNYIKIVIFFLNQGMDINIWDGWPLKYASAANNFKMVELLLNKGADINVNNDEPLKYAIANNNIKIVKLLINRGANRKLLENKNDILNTFSSKNTKAFPCIFVLHYYTDDGGIGIVDADGRISVTNVTD